MPVSRATRSISNQNIKNYGLENIFSSKTFFTSFNIVINDLLVGGKTCGSGLWPLEAIKTVQNHVFSLDLEAKSMISIDFV